MTFPTTRLALRIEAAFGADLAASPSSWAWTDLSDRLFGDQAVRLGRGRPNEAAATQPTALTVALDNIDGELTPRNTASSYYPNVRKGTPIRVWSEGATPGLYLPGVDGSYCSTPDHASLDFSGDFDIRVLVHPFQWVGPTDADHQVLLSKAGGSGNRSYVAGLSGRGRPWLRLNGLSDLYGRIPIYAADLVGQVAELHPTWLGWAFDQSTGVGSTTGIDMYAWPDDGTDPPADITDWLLISQATDLFGTGAPAANSAPVELGTLNGGDPDIFESGGSGFEGVFLKAELRNGINGTVVADPDFTAAAPGATTVTDSTGKVWTLHGAAQITTDRVRYSGQIANLDRSWPLGDNDPGGAHGSEHVATVEIGDVLRRLGQGRSPIRSCLARTIINRPALAPDGYWPWEESAGAARFASAVSTASAAPVTGWKFAADSSLQSSAALPTLDAGVAGSWSAAVTGAAGNPIYVTWIMKIPTPEASPSSTRLMTITTTGNIQTFHIDLDDTDITVQGLDSTPSVIFTDSADSDFGEGALWGRWVIAEFSIIDLTGPTRIQWRIGFRPIDGGDEYAMLGVETAVTHGTITNVAATNVGPPGGMSMGHVVVANGNDYADGWVDAAACGHIGETAAARFYRVAREEGLSVEIIGDYLRTDQLPAVTSSPESFGDIALSEPMGAQLPGKTIDVLQQCVDVDGGILVSRPTAPGLVYRSRASLRVQPVRLALTGAAGNPYLRAGLASNDDDLSIRNDITVKIESGASARIVDQDHIDEVGRYDDEVTLNGIGGTDLLLAPGYRSDVASELAALVDTQAATIAERLLLFGTFDADRWRNIAAELSIGPALIPAWHDLHPGDRVTLTGLPAQHPDGLVELLAEGLEEIMTPSTWRAGLQCSPGGPWLLRTELAAALAAELTTTGTGAVSGAGLSIEGSPAWVNGTGNQAVANPSPSGLGTMLAILVSQGTTNSPTLTITPPPGVTVTSHVADASSLFRVNVWTYANDGAGKTFGASGGADNRCSAILVPLSGLFSGINVATAIEASSTSVGFNSVTTAADDLVFALATRRDASDTGAPAGYTTVDADVSTATAWRSGLWVDTASGGPTTTPPTITWSAGGPKRQYAIRIRG